MTAKTTTTHKATIQHGVRAGTVAWGVRCTCGRTTVTDTLASAERWATTHDEETQ